MIIERILFITPGTVGYAGAFYQQQFQEALQRACLVRLWNPAIEPWPEGFEPSLLVFGHAWGQDEEPPDVPQAKWAPSVMLINKEYKGLDWKLAYAARHDVSLIFSSVRPEWWESRRITPQFPVRREIAGAGIPVRWLPFAAEQSIFYPRAGFTEYAVGFSGALHEPHGMTIRRRMGERLEQLRQRNPGLRVSWSDSKTGTPDEYAQHLAKAQVWLATPGPLDVITPRYFEIMAMGGPVCMAPEAPGLYEPFFTPGTHLATFRDDLSDFEEVLFALLEDGPRRYQMTLDAYKKVRQFHTWDVRVQQFLKAVEEDAS